MKTDLRSMLVGALLSRRHDLESALQQAKISWRDWNQRPGKEDPADEVDGALHETSTHNHYSLMERKVRELRKIDDLLHRMRNDEEFGLCEECGDPIPIKRLMILPDATFCVPCQCRLERRNGLRLSGAWGANYASERRARDWENPDDEETALFDAHIESINPVDPDSFRSGSPFEGENLDG
ncbi:MAG: TraR/DksA family transcriptional regulator [Thermodesulfobacteriota bacterium]